MRASVLSRGLVVAGALAVIGILGASPGSASASTGAWWHLVSDAFPTQLQPGSTQHIIVSAVNRGYENISGAGAPIVLTDKLPADVEVTELVGRSVPTFTPGATEPFPPTCSFTAHEAICTDSDVVKPYARLWMLLTVKVAAKPAPSEASNVAVAGGEIPGAAMESQLNLAGGPQSFGLENYELSPEEPGGAPATQAGAHPFQLTTTLGFHKTERVPFYSEDQTTPLEPQLAKEVNVKLPPGLIGNPTPFPQCTAAQFVQIGEQRSNSCPQDSAVGEANITFDEPKLFGINVFTVPIFNLVPDKGEPARFGFTVFSAPIYLDTSVRTGGDYGITVHVGNISELVALLESEVVFWGVPGDHRHDIDRGWNCGISEEARLGSVPCKLQEELHPKPLLVMPTSCTGPLQTSAEASSWASPETILSYGPTTPTTALDGCNRLNFEPRVSVTPDGQAASSPSGLGVDVHVPQDESLTPAGLSQANVKSTTVALPEGLALDPSAADGLQSCSLAQISLESQTSPSCPEASKVGTVTIHTPLLPEPLTGAAYLAAQNANPFGSLVALYVVAEDPQAGVVVKLAGEVHLSESGQIVSTFENTPQLPFEDFELQFFGGARAPLTTPPHCGTYTTHASLSPWSGTEPVSTSSSFSITSGPNGSPCPGSSLPFTPSLTAGMTNISAGAFSPLVTTISREDGNQNISSLQLHFPPGVSGALGGVPLCGEAAANAGTCGTESQIGETAVSVGLGGDPYTVKGGRVYITGPYHGAPFGLSIVTPAVAGPFNLGTVVVRGKLEVDRRTAALTFTSNSESEGFAIPHVLDGIPLEIKHVNVSIGRPGFTFNPTNCEPMAISGAIDSVEGSAAPVQEHFQVTNCANLSFKPTVAVSTAGKASRANGTSLSFKIAYPKGAMGSESWFKEAKFTLPKQLPARLTTIQKACVASTFEANPDNCPAASKIGHAVVHTQILPVPLEGPVYFVSYGGAQFPEAVLALKGYGITVDLHGETFIHNGVTSATFKSTPDVPFESIEVSLPSGPFSEFGANLPHESFNFCGRKLVIPTLFKAQNGLEIKQNTPIAISGCAKSLTKPQKLTAALKACRKKKGQKRSACERSARAKYASAKKSAKAKGRHAR